MDTHYYGGIKKYQWVTVPLAIHGVVAKKDGTIAGGMIPKVDSCIDAVHNGVNKAHIIDGRVEHSILLELFTSEGIGTQFIRVDNPNNGIDMQKLLSE